MSDADRTPGREPRSVAASWKVTAKPARERILKSISTYSIVRGKSRVSPFCGHGVNYSVDVA